MQEHWWNNIIEHPKTTVAGVLIGAVALAPVFAQQGITFGKAGNGTMISLITGLATVLLGLLAKDPS